MLSTEEIEFHVLTRLSSGENYGYELHKRLKELGTEMPPRRMYKILDSLRERGVLTCEVREAKKQVVSAGTQCRHRKYFRLTDRGNVILHQKKQDITTMIARLNSSLRASSLDVARGGE